MGFKRLLPPPNEFNGVKPGGRATLELIVGPRYHSLLICGKDPADATKKIADIVEEIELLFGNNVQRKFTPSELHYMNTRYGAEYGNIDVGDAIIGGENATEFQLPIFLSEWYRKITQLAEFFAWPTGLFPNGKKSVQSFVVRVKLKDDAPETSQLYALVEADDTYVKGEKGEILRQPVGLITKWERLDIPFVGAAGNISGSLIEIKEVLQGISIFDADIYKVEIYANDSKLWEITKERSDANLKRHGMSKSISQLKDTSGADHRPQANTFGKVLKRERRKV